MELTVPGACRLGPVEFQACVADSYGMIAQQLRGRAASEPVRFWNYVPCLHRDAGNGMNQYEVFNAGRFNAYTKWYGTTDFGTQLATASAVDHRGDDYTVHLLAAKRPGMPTENPRQKPAYKYSRRYGPMPPCFSRAVYLKDTVTGREEDLLLVAGTASIVEESTQHVGDLHGQIVETRTNLSRMLSLIQRGDEKSDSEYPLMRFRELRIYYSRESDANDVTAAFRDAFPSAYHLELMPADLCRSDLLVEVEGIATRSTKGAVARC